MKLLPFKESAVASMGIELEFQIVDASSFELVARSKDIIRALENVSDKARIKPEITQGMIEINSSIHHSPQKMMAELLELQAALLNKILGMGIHFCGGGSHPFQDWIMQKIFPMARYRKISRKFRYLSKRATLFGQHVHIGCKDGDDAIYLTNAFARYAPQLIAINASSPFYRGIDTGYFSVRTTMFSAFPTSGMIPEVQTWKEFSDYFYKMREWGIIESMKDMYWDIRPKPEFGTVEIRVLDTPLTLKKAVMVAAYIQLIAHYLLEERPFQFTQDLYHLYQYNRFQASRYGLDGEFIDPFSSQHHIIRDDILDTMNKVKKYAQRLGSMDYLEALREDIMNKKNDTVLLREIFKQAGSFPDVVAEQCRQWLNYRKD